MADPQGKNRLQEFKYKGKDQDVSKWCRNANFNPKNSKKAKKNFQPQKKERQNPQ